MRELLIALVLGSLMGCMQTENSSSQDADLYGIKPDGSGSSAFVTAQTIFSQSCVPCHTFHAMSEAQLVAGGYLIAGNPEGSKIFYRLTGSSGSTGPKNMPTSGPLSAADVEAIKTWITQYTP